MIEKYRLFLRKCLKVWKVYNKLSTIFLISGIVLVFGIAEYYVDIKPPSFESEIENSLIQNQALMHDIGEWKTINFSYTDDKEADNTFSFTVKGKCGNSFVKSIGTYNKKEYIITDTIIHKCK